MATQTKPQTGIVQELQVLQDDARSYLQQLMELRTLISQNQSRTAEIMNQQLGASISSSPVPVVEAASVAAPKRGRGGRKAASSDGTAKMTLKEAVFDILSRKEHAKGLKPSEIVDLILKEKKWVSSSADISGAVSTAIHGMKKVDKLIVRIEGGGYTLKSPA